ncbi:MAG: putative outer membrane repeat protein [Polaribacter sp.]|jgi:predicted outer membrane repeat protein
MLTACNQMIIRTCASFLLLAFSICTGFSQNKIYVDVTAGTGGDGSSWSTAYDDLQDALALAESTLTQDDTIWVAQGIYYPNDTDRTIYFDIPHITYLYGGFDGTENLLSQRDIANNETILSGDIDEDDGPGYSVNTPDFDNSSTVVRMKLLCLYSLIDGFTISGGVADMGAGALMSSSGGGVFIDGGSSNGGVPVFRNTIFKDNYALQLGGAIYADGRSGGYAHYAAGNCLFINNKSIFNGGAIQNDGECSSDLIYSTFTGNTASFGGAIYNNGTDGVCSPSIVSCIFNENLSFNLGGAIYSFGRNETGVSSPHLVNCLVYDNTSSVSAAGLYCLASEGGTSEMQVTNSTFYSNNAANGNGGHIYVNESNTGNGKTTIRNSIFWSSVSDFNPHFHMSQAGGGTPEIDLDYSLVDAIDCDSLYFGNDGTLTCGGNVLYEDPGAPSPNTPDFVDEGNRNFRLEASSSALDVGDETFLPMDLLDFDMDMDSMELLSIERDWNHRVAESAPGSGMVIDFGAYEFNSSPVLPSQSLPDEYEPLPPQSPLPVELLSFTARPEAGKVSLQWVTLAEDNNDYFTIERSVNGVDFEAIHREEGAGSTGLARTYQTYDNNPFVGKDYYRLKQTDFDGRFEYSGIRVVEILGEGQLKVFPNPVTNTLNVALSGFKVREVSFEIYHLSGKMMYSGSSEVNGGVVVIALENVEQLLPGSYIIRIVNKKGADLFGKFLKVRL